MTDPSHHRSVADGGDLRALSNGLVIVRRKKHEYDARLETLKGEALERFTDPIRGSKFGSDWTIARCIEWIEAQVIELGWTTQSSPNAAIIEIGTDVGCVRGNRVTKVKIVLSSRRLHAYPVQE